MVVGEMVVEVGDSILEKRNTFWKRVSFQCNLGPFISERIKNSFYCCQMSKQKKNLTWTVCQGALTAPSWEEEARQGKQTREKTERRVLSRPPINVRRLRNIHFFLFSFPAQLLRRWHRGVFHAMSRGNNFSLAARWTNENAACFPFYLCLLLVYAEG